MNQLVYSTGITGTIGKSFPSSVKALSVRLGAESNLGNVSQLNQETPVIHLAASVGHIGDISNESSHNINVVGTMRLAEECLKRNIPKFVFASTSHVYSNSIEPVSETSPVTPISDYGLQKLQAEQLLLEIFAQNPDKLIIARIFSVLDFNMNPNTLGGKIERVFLERTGETLGTSDDVRDFSTPDSVGKTLLSLSRHPEAYGIYNVCSGKGITVSKAAQMLLKDTEYFDNQLISNGNSAVPFLVGVNTKLSTILPNNDFVWKYAG